MNQSTTSAARRAASAPGPIPPSQALIDSTWRMFAGSRIATGDWTLVWPPSDGSRARAKSGMARIGAAGFSVAAGPHCVRREPGANDQSH